MCPVAFATPSALFEEWTIPSLIAAVERSLSVWIRDSVVPSARPHLMSGGLEPVRQRQPRRILSLFRLYLRVPSYDHRWALAQVVCGDTRFAVDIMGWASRYREPVNVHLHLRRFCKTLLEVPEHTILACNALHELRDMRRVFWKPVGMVSDIRPPVLARMAKGRLPFAPDKCHRGSVPRGADLSRDSDIRIFSLPLAGPADQHFPPRRPLSLLCQQFSLLNFSLNMFSLMYFSDVRMDNFKCSAIFVYCVGGVAALSVCQLLP